MKKYRGFTLVELMATVAIIAVLVGLLLPAIQSARESARRVACANNLKQIGLALHGYAAANGSFPPGCAWPKPPFGNSLNVGWGNSWVVFILPYVEQTAVYANWDFSIPAYSGSAAFGVAMPVLRCASSPLPALRKSGNASSKIATSSYVAIMGADEAIFKTAQIRTADIPYGFGSRGSWGGMMFTNSRMTFAHCRDGASNVFVVGEQSNYLVDVNGMQQAWSASSYGGWSNGCDSFGTLPWTLWRSYNTNTIRYGINLTRNGWDGATAGVGSSHNDSPAGMPMNIPLNSSHPGVAGVLWADGAVGYLGETTSLDVLARLSTRDDAALVTGN